MKDKETIPQISFTKRVAIFGDFQSYYVFATQKDVDLWVNNDFPALVEKYGDTLTYKVIDLPGLKVGDTCLVQGEGSDTFKILNLKKLSPNRYSFGLDSGWYEEVAKCYTLLTP